MHRLLIAANDAEFRTALAMRLHERGYQLEDYSEGAMAFEALLSGCFNLAIIDWQLPGIGGMDITRELRRRSVSVAVLMISPHANVADRVAGLNAGADDYLVKPFQMPELEARVRALLRRSTTGPDAPIHVGPLTVTPGQPRVHLCGTAVQLTRREFALLELLTAHTNRTVRKSAVAKHLGDVGSPSTDAAIEMCLYRLRRRLAPFGLKILTVRGIGYVLEHSSRESPGQEGPVRMDNGRDGKVL